MSTTSKACTFVKRKRGNIRKKQTDYSAIEDDSANAVVKKTKKEKENPTVASTKDFSNKVDDTKKDLDVYKTSGTAVPHGSADMGATMTFQEETERKEKKEPEILAGDDAEKAEKIYRGMNNYTEWIEKKELHGLAKGSGIRSGPLRAPIHIRQTVRFDYQPDVCKDYKETGYCGFGDSCKFMHDRGDYKSGWELEKEWEEQQKRKQQGINEGEEDYEVREEEEEDLPFACAICRNFFVDPVVTKCKHFFCERCALNNFKKDMKCFTCGTNTLGTFSTVDKKTREKLEKRMQQALERGENVQEEEEEEQEEKEGQSTIVFDKSKPVKKPDLDEDEKQDKDTIPQYSMEDQVYNPK